MSSAVRSSSRPCFLTLITSIPRKPLPRQHGQSKLWASIPPACGGSHDKTRALSSCNQNPRLSASIDQPGELFRKSKPSTISYRGFCTSSSSSDSYNAPNAPRKDLPSQEEGRRSLVSKRFSNVMDHVQSNIFMAGQRLNDLTGYSGIEALKKDIEEQEKSMQTSRSSLQQAREAYSTAISQRSSSQREVNELLQRKHAWTANDLERFTALYRSDHANEQAESAAHDALVSVERQAEEAAARLSASILARYHEEQIWSDKIRRMSTWGTWGLMGVNVLLFLVFQVAVEPWRRRRLVKGFEDKVMDALKREAPPAGTVESAHVPFSEAAPLPEAVALDGPRSVIDPIVESAAAVAFVEKSGAYDPATDFSPAVESRARSLGESFTEAISDMFSERHVTVQCRDMTALALEGVAAGMALMGVAVLVILRPR